MTTRRISFTPTATPAAAIGTANTARVQLAASDESASESSWQGFEKLFASVLDPQTQDNHQRHLALAKNVIFQNEHGWKLVELPVVSDFIQLLRDKVTDGLVQFTDPLLAAITLCCKPFVRLKSNEEISNPALLHGILPTLAQLLSFELLDVQVAAAEALLQFAIGASLARTAKPRSNNTEPSADDLRLTPRVLSQNLMEETGVVDAVVGVLYDLFPDNNDGDDKDDERNGDTAVDRETLEEDAASAAGSTRSSLVNFPPSSAASKLTVRSQYSDAEQRPVSPTTPSTPTTPIQSAREATPSTSSRLGQDRPLTSENEHPLTNLESGLTDDSTPALTTEQRVAAIVFPVVEIVYELSSHQRCAEVLVLSGALHYVVFILESIRDPQDELLPLCLVVLWNVLELCHEKMRAMTTCTSRRELLVHFRLRNAAYFLANEFTLQTLLHVFELLLARGYRKQDKELRNECVMVLTLLARRRRSLDHFYSTGLTASLLSYATAVETKRKRMGAKTAAMAAAFVPSSARAVAINADHHNYATNSDEDFEFKQMLWFLLAEVAGDHDANCSELVQFRFAEILLRYATGRWASDSPVVATTATSTSPQQHTPAQLQALQVTALSVLNHIAPSILDHLFEIGVHTVLFEYLQRSVQQSDENLAAAWLLLAQISPPTRFYQDELGRIGTVEVAVAAFAAPPLHHTFGIRRNALLACASMCRGHEANRIRFQRAHGVHVVLQHLAFDPSHSVLEENIVIAIVDAVRSCIVGNAESESAFIDDDGVPKLLAVLERVPLKAVKNQALAALAEICVNPAAIPSFVAWRSDERETNNFTATQLLLRIYAHEDAIEELRGARSESDGDAEVVVALANARQSAFRSVTTCRNPFIVSARKSEDSDTESPSIDSERPQSPAFARLKEALKAAQSGGGAGSRVTAGRQASLLELRDSESHPEVNLKAKIYAVLANVSFASDKESLTTRDQVMLEVAKEYPTFQVGEMWQNVHVALHAEGVRPIYADALYIRRHIEHAYNLSVCTKHAQREISARSRTCDAASEDAFLQQLLLQKHQEAQAEAFHRADLRQNSTIKLHFDAKRTRLEFLRRQDPTAFAAYENSSDAQLADPAPACDYSDLNSLEQKEAELRGRLGTLSQRK